MLNSDLSDSERRWRKLKLYRDHRSRSNWPTRLMLFGFAAVAIAVVLCASGLSPLSGCSFLPVS
jgi:hypothetical protein